MFVQDSNAGPSRGRRNTTFLSSTSEGHNLHREKTIAVSCSQMPWDALDNTCRFCAERLQSLIRTLELSRLDEYSALQKVASFATLVSTYEKGMRVSESMSSHWALLKRGDSTGFLLILEPFETDNATVPNPVFHFTFVGLPMLRRCD